MEQKTTITPFNLIYDSFLARVTDEMYMELTQVDTFRLLQELLVNAIPRFEFPRFDIFDYELGYMSDGGVYNGAESDYEDVQSTIWVGGYFNADLTQEEINILAMSMMVEWFGQQLAITENTKMKYTGADFKMTSQANHMAKLKVMIDAYKQETFHLQRLYKRRKFVNGEVRSTAGLIMNTPSYGKGILKNVYED